MVDLKNIEYKPSIEEITKYIDNPLFIEFYQYINTEYQPIITIEYSKDVWLKGWNIKFKKSGKSLCVIYPKENYFVVLVVVGKKEKLSVEKQLSNFSNELQEIYNNTNDGMGQKWLMIDLNKNDKIYKNVLELIKIRRESK